jgi:hypothetical protein
MPEGVGATRAGAYSALARNPKSQPPEDWSLVSNAPPPAPSKTRKKWRVFRWLFN